MASIGGIGLISEQMPSSTRKMCLRMHLADSAPHPGQPLRYSEVLIDKRRNGWIQQLKQWSLA
jgi:hypothetical protein